MKHIISVMMIIGGVGQNDKSVITRIETDNGFKTSNMVLEVKMTNPS